MLPSIREQLEIALRGKFPSSTLHVYLGGHDAAGCYRVMLHDATAGVVYMGWAQVSLSGDLKSYRLAPLLPYRHVAKPIGARLTHYSQENT